VDLAQVREQLEAQDWIASAKAVYLPGGTIVVEVVERTPRATIALGKPLERYAVDAAGIPFAVVAGDALTEIPVLVAIASINPREADARLAEAIRLAYRLPELGVALPTEVSIAADSDAEGFALRFASIAPRFVLGRGDPDAQLAELARLLTRHPDVITDAASVDLRFADQVVLRSEPTSKGAAAEPGGRPVPLNRRPAG